jgi:hypothetical protein
MSDILEEIQTDLRDEQLLQTLKKYSKYAILLAIVIIASTIFFNYQKQSKIDKQQAISNIYYEAQTALKNNNLDEAKIFLNKVIDTKNQNFAPFAALELSKIFFDQGNVTEGKTVLQKVISNQDYNIMIRELAEITAISYNGAEDVNADIARLKILSKANSPWEISAKLLLAEKLMQVNLQSAERTLLELKEYAKTPTRTLFIVDVMLQNIKQKNKNTGEITE